MKIKRRLIEVITLLVLYRNKCVLGKITSACAPEGHLTQNPRGTIHCCMKCPQILREKTSSEKYTVISLKIQW